MIVLTEEDIELEPIKLTFKVELIDDYDSRTVTIPIDFKNAYTLCKWKGVNWIVDWGDGKVEKFHISGQNEPMVISHTYCDKAEDETVKYYDVLISYDMDSDTPVYYGWASCIKSSTLIKFSHLARIVQVPYMSQGKSVSDKGDNFCYGIFANCTELESDYTIDDCKYLYTKAMEDADRRRQYVLEHISYVANNVGVPDHLLKYDSENLNHVKILLRDLEKYLKNLGE
jgi:hypothetical protein